MISSLYIRTVLVFIIVVIVSSALSFFISLFMFQRDISKKVSEDMLSAGTYAIQLIKQSEMKSNDLHLQKWVSIQKVSLILYSEEGVVEIYSKSASNPEKPVLSNLSDVKLVLDGEVLLKPQSQSIEISVPFVGLPFQFNGKKYALFIQPDLGDQDKEFQRLPIIILIISLIIGSLLILLASKYLVSPLKKLTSATKRLAQGDFSTQVEISRVDEIGQLAKNFNHMAKELGQLEQMRQDFVANVSHEFQTPLTTINGFSNAIRQRLVSGADLNRYLDIIQSECARMSKLSDNLLKLASLESTNHLFHKHAFFLDAQLRQVLAICMPLIMKKKIVYDVNLPRTKIMADEELLIQVWTNLLHNSIKFTPEAGRIEISLTTESGYVIFRIEDSGIGISQDEQQLIFQRFYKTDLSRNSSQEGNGLGLSIVEKIVDLHQGYIQVDSKPGNGTSFTIRLPL